MSNEISLITTSDRFLKIFNEEKKQLPSDYQNIRDKGFLSDYFKYLLMVKKLDPQNVLDWGAGNGHISYLMKHGLGISTDSYCVNPDPRTLKFLNKLDLNLIISDNKFDLPFKSNSYDIVISSGVLEHVNEYGGEFSHSLNEIIRVLKPQGYFVIWRLPFAFSIWEFFRYLLNHWYHPERYTPMQIKILCEKYNLELVEIGLDGIFFVSFRCFLRKYKILNLFVNYLEVSFNKIPLFHFLLNDIFCVLRKK